jgi:hypothetical protein
MEGGLPEAGEGWRSSPVAVMANDAFSALSFMYMVVYLCRPVGSN